MNSEETRMRAALLLLLLAPALACAQAGRFLLAAGDVTLVRGGKEIRAVAGAAVEAGDTIRVGPRSNVQLRMSDQAIVSLRANTEFRIDEYVYSGRGDDSDRSVFSLIKGGMRTVSGAIARPQGGALLQTAAKPQAPSGPQPTAEEKKPREESDSKVVDAIRAPLRAVAGALTPTRHAVKVPTATIGIRGTHYTLVHCNNDCFERGRTSVASALLAQSDAGSPGLGSLAPNGTYGGVTDGLIGVVNNAGDKEFGANSFFYVASPDTPVQGLIGPPAFLYDRLEAQDRNRGQGAKETTANMPNSGLNAESRPSDTPLPPRPPQFVVTEERTPAGDLTVVPGDPGTVVPPVPTPSSAFLSAFTNANGGPDTVAAFVDSSALTIDTSDGVHLVAFSAPAGSTSNPATGPYSGTTGGPIDDTDSSNPIGAIWGRWVAGRATDASGETTFSSANNVFHYLVGPLTPPEVIAAKTGTLTFLHVGGTAVTHNESTALGNFSGNFDVNFTARTVSSVGLSLSFPNQSWSFGNVTTPIQTGPGRGAFIESSALGTCSGGRCATSTAADLSMKGAFMGPAGDHLGVSFNAKAGTAAAQTVQMFSPHAPR
jgi:hypothetical protein